jgi:SMC interacting uncharacterized protein involved in chromosome segregation
MSLMCVTQLQADRAQAMEDLRSVENAFSDLHRRYEKLKEQLNEQQAVEAEVRSALARTQQDVDVATDRFAKLKEHAEQQLSAANAEIDRLKRERDNDRLVMQSKIAMLESRATSAEQARDKEAATRKELQDICEALMERFKSDS